MRPLPATGLVVPAGDRAGEQHVLHLDHEARRCLRPSRAGAWLAFHEPGAGHAASRGGARDGDVRGDGGARRGRCQADGQDAGRVQGLAGLYRESGPDPDDQRGHLSAAGGTEWDADPPGDRSSDDGGRQPSHGPAGIGRHDRPGHCPIDLRSPLSGSGRSQVSALPAPAQVRGGGPVGPQDRPRVLHLSVTPPPISPLEGEGEGGGEAAMDERKARFTSLSGFEIARVYSPDDLKGWNPETDLGRPDEFPYTRGVYPTMYRGRLWTMRQFAGFGTAEDTNRRFKYLLQHGQTGLSVAFDLPTLMGLDSDDPRARGEVGYCGVAVSSLEDMERLFDGIPLDQVTTSMTINGPAAVIFAMYLAVAERRGIPFGRLRAAALVLLQRAQRLLRGDRQVPGGPPPVGARDGAPAPSERPAVPPAPLSRPDRGLLAHGPAADEQRRPHHASGACSGAGRDPVAAYQFDGRDLGAADRRGGQAGAAHPADHRA